MITLENQYLVVTVSEKGAELTSVKNKENQIEYLWQGDPSFWKRQAPVLFPFVGRLKNDQYEYNHKTYHMSQHGFARDYTFNVTHQSESEVALELTANEATKENYPFDFRLTLTYSLEKQTVRVAYQVENLNHQEKMYFSIGGHPGFNIPLTNETSFEDYYLSFLPKRSRTVIPLKGSYLDLENRTLGQTNTDIALRRALFDQDALIYETKNKNTFSIRSDKTPHGIAVSFENFPYVGIWSPAKQDAPLVCIEPWFGIADATDASGKLEEKMGIQLLEPNGQFNCHYDITIE